MPRSGVSVALIGFVALLLISGTSARESSNRNHPPQHKISPPDMTTGSRSPTRDRSPSAPGDSFVVASYDFEADTPAAQEWTGVDRTAQIDRFFHVADSSELDGGSYGGLFVLEGLKSLWCGVRASSSLNPYCNWSTLPGYGNRWVQGFESVALPVTGDVTVQYLISFDTEPGFDYGYFEFDHVDTGWTALRTYTGYGSTSESIIIPAASIGDSARLRFVFRSDGAWSDEDALWDTDGAMIIDSLTISDTTGIVDFQDFETEPPGARETSDGDWRAIVPDVFGDYSGIVDGDTVVQEDPSFTNTSLMWAFFNGSTDYDTCGVFPSQQVVPYGPVADSEELTEDLYLHNEIWSPPIDWTQDTTGDSIPEAASSVVLEVDVYGDMEINALVFFDFGVRGQSSSCWSQWYSDRHTQGGNLLHTWPYKEWKTLRWDITEFINQGADSIQVSLVCQDLCPQWCGVVGDGSCHSHGPLFDNVRVIRFRPAVCQVTPESLDFGTVAVGDSLDQTFTITNTSTSGLLSGTVQEFCSHYSIVSGAAYSLAGGQSQEVTVRFKPTSIGTHLCTVETGDDLCSVACTGDAPPIQYVDADATGSGDGLSWVNAYPELRDALVTADSTVTAIWVAAGTYTPTHSADRAYTFQLRDSLALFGGFAGGETTLEERDWLTNQTVLSGDIGAVADSTDNSYHVVTASGTDASAVLDGFVITGGNADGGGGYAYGGGMYLDAGGATLANLTFTENSASFAGGGMFCAQATTPSFTNVIFTGNFTASYGGGLANDGDAVLMNVVFTGNWAGAGGGGLSSYMSNSIVKNATFSNNSAGSIGGGIYVHDSEYSLVNTIMWGDAAPTSAEIYDPFSSSAITISHSLIDGSGGSGGGWDGSLGTDGGNNLDADPRFVDAPNGDLRLSLPSPAIDAGDSTAVPPGVTTDLDNNPRICGTNVDLGAYEYQAVIAVPDDRPALPVLGLRVHPNPFGRSTTVVYSLPEASPVRIDIYDAQGRLVRTLYSGHEAAGDHVVPWDGRTGGGMSVAAGLYFVKLDALHATRVGKVIMVP